MTDQVQPLAVAPETRVDRDPPREPSALVALAIERGMAPEQMTQVFALIHQQQDRQARDHFGRMLAEFQRLCPVVQKTRPAKDRNGNVMYKYASFEDVAEVAKPHLAATGFSYSFEIDDSQEGRRLICVRMQNGGWQEDRSYPFAVVQRTGMMDDAKAYNSSLSANKRFALCAAFGIVIGDEEDPAAEVRQKLIHGDHAIHLHELMKQAGASLKRFTDWASATAGFEVASIGALPDELYEKAAQALNGLVAQKKKESQK